MQDEIKRRAAARKSREWKEPVVKQVKVTAADLKSATTSAPQSPPSVAPMNYNATELNSIKRRLEEMNKELQQNKLDIQQLQKENKELRALVEKNAVGAFPLGSPPASPKKNKPPASLEPHTASDLVAAQRSDKALRTFMKTKEGLYDAKYMSLREESNVGNIVCFKKKIYVPLKLREKTIQYYKHEHSPDSVALATLRKNCCWPDLEKDFFA